MCDSTTRACWIWNEGPPTAHVAGRGQIDRMTASNQVVITLVRQGFDNLSLPVNRTTGTNRIHAAVAEHTSTNDTVTFTGSPSRSGNPGSEGAEGSFRADVITFDRTRDRIDLRATSA